MQVTDDGLGFDIGYSAFRVQAPAAVDAPSTVNCTVTLEIIPAVRKEYALSSIVQTGLTRRTPGASAALRSSVYFNGTREPEPIENVDFGPDDDNYNRFEFEENRIDLVWSKCNQHKLLNYSLIAAVSAPANGSAEAQLDSTHGGILRFAVRDCGKA
ncbi:hypothetical protein GCM10010124_11450 [Pilimelia terevasa]|uniref:Uncharacterized protein n=1 Tax=Pilimelia terevasa TaxID=53372 RepID=A0A8J3FIT0_9ACTN|nr:hypothetical protein GCM10010124_11450 [Pilimelia terevasa]